MATFSLTRPITIAAVLCAAAAALHGPPGAASSSALDVTVQQIATGIGPITSITNAGDPRLFLTVQTGRIVIFSGGQVQPAAFLDLSGAISCCGERGLLGLAFHPGFASNRWVYLYYSSSFPSVSIHG